MERPAARWATHGYWLWLWLQSRETSWIIPYLHENGLDENCVGKFEVSALASGGEPKAHLLLLQTLVQLQESVPGVQEEQLIPFPTQALLEMVSEAKEQIAKGIKTEEAVPKTLPVRAGRRYTRIIDSLPKQTINPAAKRQVRLQGRALSCYVPQK